MLGYMEQTPLYNAANFAVGPGASGGMIGSMPNRTIYNTVINSYLCPSDPNADLDRSNSYHASIGSTTYESPITTPGMFAVWTAYGLRDCTDGSSNTIAFAEALTGQDGASFGYGSQMNDASGTLYRGNLVTSATDPGFPTGQGPDHPNGYYAKGDQYLYASSNPANIITGLQAFRQAMECPPT